MHYHLEIIMPPTDDVNAAVTRIMEPFYEGSEDEDKSAHPFWDYWVIGGRWSGAKLPHNRQREKLDAFFAALKDQNITVSGIQWGKQELQPAEQTPVVDRLWREHFPDSPAKQCPIFKHYTGADGDVMALKDVDKNTTCCHLIVAGPKFKTQEPEAVFMLKTNIWNGVNHQETEWDGTIGQGLQMHIDKLYKPAYAKKITPQPDWLVVTVDYHS